MSWVRRMHHLTRSPIVEVTKRILTLFETTLLDEHDRPRVPPVVLFVLRSYDETHMTRSGILYVWGLKLGQ